MALTGAQKFAAWLVILGAAALCAGSAAPFWGRAGGNAFGLWYWCTGSDCDIYDWAKWKLSHFTEWFFVAHAACGLATLLALGVGFVLLAKVCGDGENVTGTGVAALLAGLLGAAGAVLCYFRLQDVIGPAVAAVGDGAESWAFYTFGVGAGLLVLSGIVMLAVHGPNKTAVKPY